VRELTLSHQLSNLGTSVTTSPTKAGLERPHPILFRQSAVEAALGTQIGEAFAAHWRGVKVFTVFAFTLTAALFLFIGTIEYSPSHRVPCYTDAQNGLARLNAPADGQIIDLPISEGTRVKKGDLLATLSTDKLREGGDSQHSALGARLQAERDMIEREIDAARKEAAANHEMIVRRIAGLRLEQDSARADSQSAEQLLGSLRAQLDQFTSLVTQGYVSKLQLAQKRDEVTLQESRVAASRATLRRIERDIATSEAEQNVVDAKLNGLIENRRRAAGELERLLVQSDVDSQQVIRAPMDGIVSTALIVKGQSVEQGQALFSVAAANAPLIIRLLVPARAAAAVKPGLDIRFVLRAYPREKFGDFAARVLNVSATPALPGDVTQVLPVSEAAFVAVASLPRGLRGPDGRALWLQPGMIGDALVPIERRTILEWLLDPILRGFNSSSRSSGLSPAEGIGR
jgi:membrane fusion protein